MVRLIDIEKSTIDVEALVFVKDLGQNASPARYVGHHLYELTFIGGLVTRESWPVSARKELLEKWQQ